MAAAFDYQPPPRGVSKKWPFKDVNVQHNIDQIVGGYTQVLDHDTETILKVQCAKPTLKNALEVVNGEEG